MKVLLIGGSGQLGTEIARLPRDWELFVPTHRELAIEDEPAARRILRDFAPRLVINACGGYDNVLGCETDPSRAFRQNVVAMGGLCRAIRDAGARLLTFGTDYVFPGDKAEAYTEDDLPRPIMLYGIVRLAEEHIARSILEDDVMIVRASGVFGIAGRASRGGNFLDKRIAEAARGAVIEIACEQTASPTYAVDLAAAACRLAVDLPWEGGVYHLANQGRVSWYEFTRMAFAHLDWESRVKPIDRGGLDGTMRRPRNSALACARANRRGVSLPPVDDAVQRYLKAAYPGLLVKPGPSAAAALSSGRKLAG